MKIKKQEMQKMDSRKDVIFQFYSYTDIEIKKKKKEKEKRKRKKNPIIKQRENKSSSKLEMVDSRQKRLMKIYAVLSINVF